MKNLNFVAGMTQRFVSPKRLEFSNSSKLVEHRAQSPVREVKMLADVSSLTDIRCQLENEKAKGVDTFFFNL